MNLPKPVNRVRAVDVAARAEVSVATVSMVVNGKAAGRVSPAVQERVTAVIAEMGYTVNPAARSLVTGRSRCIALIASDVTNPYISTIAAGVAAAIGSDYQLLLAVSGAERDLPDIPKVLAFGVDGVLVNLPVSDAIRERAPDLPIVALDDPGAPAAVSRVFFAVKPGARALSEHLVEFRHRTIVYLDVPRPYATFTVRRRALVERFRQLADDATVIVARSNIDVEAARDVVRREWKSWRAQGVTAVVTCADVQAYGALAAFTDMNVDVPGDVSLASFDGLPFASITNPALTTVTLPAFELGRRGAQLLSQLLADRNPGVSTLELASTLTVRASTGPARRVRK